MFNNFCSFFRVQSLDNKKISNIESIKGIKKETVGFNELMSSFQGETFGRGVYRIHKIKDIDKWSKIIEEGFPEFKGRIECFGYDWLGRQFSLDYGRIENTQPQLLMFEPGTAEVLEIPCNFYDFHEEEIPNYHDACLASAFFTNWITLNDKDLEHNKCVGYKVPLFLGGEDNINNLELSDMEVYWSICLQLINKTK